MKNYNLYKAVLFDLDGVLVDTPDLHYRALNKALAEYGYEITLEDHLDRYNGRPTKVKLSMLTDEQGLPQSLHETISNNKQRYTIDLIDRCIKPDESKIELFYYLKKNNKIIAVCSNSIKDAVVKMLDCLKLTSYCDIIIGNDEVSKPKPAPDIYLKAAYNLKIDIKDCIIVEDSPIGLEAAEKANPLKIIKVENASKLNLSLFKENVL